MILEPPAAEAVILDLDGTLLDTAPDLIGSLNDLRAEHGKQPITAGQLMPVVSHGSAALIRRGFDLADNDGQFEPLRQQLLDIYRARVSRATRPFPGMTDLVEQLETNGIPWGVVTNKPGWLAQPLLEDLGFSRRLACLVTGERVAERKPSALPTLRGCEQIGCDPAACLVVGDAERDVESGRRAGTMTLVALYGYINGEDQVMRWGADGVITHPLEILRWVVTPGQRRRHPPAHQYSRAGAA